MEHAPPGYRLGVKYKNDSALPFPLVSCSSSTLRNANAQSPSSSLFLSPLPRGHAAFRLLFGDSVIRAAYGNAAADASGSLVIADGTDGKGSVARLLEAVPHCDQRVVLVTGPGDVGRQEEGAEAECSAAQRALLRVYDNLSRVERRSHEEHKEKPHCVEFAAKGIVQCSMLATSKVIGAVLERRGSVIQDIEMMTFTHITVFPFPSLPSCAAPTDELIQISGAAHTVRRAIIEVSYCLQAEYKKPGVDKLDLGATSPPFSTNSEDQHTTLYSGPNKSFSSNIEKPNYPVPTPDNQIYTDPVPDYHNTSSQGSSAAISHRSSADSEVSEEISFRLLCSSHIVGGIIGRGGSIVQSLQDETGAYIQVSDPVRNCNERVITIYASENTNSNSSIAQHALCRVFNRSLEACIEKGFAPYHDDKGTVAARLLVPYNNIGCIMGVGGSIISQIRKKTCTHVSVFSGSLVPACAYDNERVVQVSGLSNNVIDALFEITTRLRKDIFLNKKFIDNDGTQFHSAEILGSHVPAARHRGRSHTANYHETITNNMNHLRLDNGASRKRLYKNGLTGSQWRASNQGRDLVMPIESEVQSEGSSFLVKNTTLQIAVPADLIGKIYGEGGINLEQIKEISGAELDVQGPSSGESEGMVTISGAPDQVFAAQSLLQAFSFLGRGA